MGRESAVRRGGAFFELLMTTDSLSLELISSNSSTGDSHTVSESRSLTSSANRLA